MPLTTPRKELMDRIARFQQRLAAADVDGALILQKTDLFYLAGTVQQAQLYVPAAGTPVLMVKKSHARARAESALERVLPIASPKDIPVCLKDAGLPLPARLGLECDVLPANYYHLYRSIFDDVAVADISPEIRSIRAIKSQFELEIMTDAARLADAVAAAVPALLREGISELELAGLVEARARALGHQGFLRMRLWGNELFYGHLMAGPSAAQPSYLASPTGGAGASPAVAQGAGFRRIQPHEPILVDYVFAFNGYLADHTRIFAIGDLPDDLARGHEAMCRIQERLARECLPGVTGGEIYSMAVQMAADAGYGDHFMGNGNDRVAFVGHGIGLELDEYPFIAQGQSMPLAEDMVIALEPKLIIPGTGVVGIENTHLVTTTGLRRLTWHPDEIQVVRQA
ncbi:MAG: Xaa-Pro peptidase family protein [Pseudomonadota bacterium]